MLAKHFRPHVLGRLRLQLHMLIRAPLIRWLLLGILRTDLSTPSHSIDLFKHGDEAGFPQQTRNALLLLAGGAPSVPTGHEDQVPLSLRIEICFNRASF